jgi:DNA-binding FadR family transcriptional regulator
MTQIDAVDPAPELEDRELPRRSADEQLIYRRLRREIESGRFEPGDRLPPERDLAEHFDTTRSLVRRAVQRLERERWVYRHVGRGTFVAEAAGTGADAMPAERLPKASPVDILEARMVIEPGFAELVVARATEDDLQRLETKLVSLEKSPTQQEFREAGYAFHLEIARVTRNPLLVHVFELIIEARAAAGWGRLRSLNDTPEARRGQAAANRAILEALKDRDAELARRLLRAHFGSMVASVAFRPE